jgi:hypothetical protein
MADRPHRTVPYAPAANSVAPHVLPALAEIAERIARVSAAPSAAAGYLRQWRALRSVPPAPRAGYRSAQGGA